MASPLPQTPLSGGPKSPDPQSPWPKKPGGKPPSRGKGPIWLWLVAAGIALFLLVFLLAQAFPDVWAEEGTKMSLTYSVLWLALIGSALIVRFRSRPGAALRHAAIWVAIGAGILAAYSFRHEGASMLDRMRADLFPHQGRTVGNALVLRAQENGHFVLQADVDGTHIRFLVDTGASSVVLSPADAERLGFDLSRLNFSQRFQTANGVVRGAPVTLRRVSAGPITLTNVRASVNEADMSGSLLGMSFLGRLKGYSVSGDKLTLER